MAPPHACIHEELVTDLKDAVFGKEGIKDFVIWARMILKVMIFVLSAIFLGVIGLCFSVIEKRISPEMPLSSTVEVAKNDNT
jgi:hypothetical protein